MFICAVPRNWTLSSSYVIHPLPHQQQRGIVWTAGSIPTKGVSMTNITTRVKNTGTTTIEFCTDISCYGRVTLYPNQTYDFPRSISAKGCEPPPADPITATKTIVVKTIACNAPQNGVYITSYSLQLISATNQHTVNTGILPMSNTVYTAGTCNF